VRTALTQLLVICASTFIWSAAVSQTPNRVEIIFLDVGQGDATIVISPEGRVALIDAGPDAGTLEQVRAHEITGLDIAIASHAHADHIGGMDRVITSIPVRYYMDNGMPYTTATYRNIMESLQASQITYLEANERNISLGSVNLNILPPPGKGEQNVNSVGVLVEYGDFRALLTGDSEAEELQQFLNRGVPDVTLLKAPHHGSRDALTPAWLNAVKPELVVITCGLDNRYGHPHPWALRYYRNVADRVLRTDLDGEISVLGARDGTYIVSTGRSTTTRDFDLFKHFGLAVWNDDGDLANLNDNSGRAVATYVY
jgi:beta-lactamase superfamily II metal-dependent hydrolase